MNSTALFLLWPAGSSYVTPAQTQQSSCLSVSSSGMPGVHHHNHVRPARGPDLRNKTWGSAVGGFVLLFSFFIFVETKQNKTTEHKMDHFSHFRVSRSAVLHYFATNPKVYSKNVCITANSSSAWLFFFLTVLETLTCDEQLPV